MRTRAKRVPGQDERPCRHRCHLVRPSATRSLGAGLPPPPPPPRPDLFVPVGSPALTCSCEPLGVRVRTRARAAAAAVAAKRSCVAPPRARSRPAAPINNNGQDVTGRGSQAPHRPTPPPLATQNDSAGRWPLAPDGVCVGVGGLGLAAAADLARPLRPLPCRLAPRLAHTTHAHRVGGAPHRRRPEFLH